MDKKEKKRERDRRAHEEAKPAYDALMSCYPFTLDDLPGEQWKEIAGYNGDYQVSNFGRVKSFKYKSPLILKPHLCGEYLTVALCGNGKVKQRKIHILVAQAFIPNPDNKPEVNHDDGHKMNCYVGNLYWSTRAENMQHAVKTGLLINPQGIDDSKAKIKNEADIIYIRENPKNLTQEELAEMFGINERTISAIQLGKSYPNASGTIRAKSEHPRNYISDEIRNQIRADWATGLYKSYSALARKFGYHRTTIRNIINAG